MNSEACIEELKALCQWFRCSPKVKFDTEERLSRVAVRCSVFVGGVMISNLLADSKRESLRIACQKAVAVLKQEKKKRNRGVCAGRLEFLKAVDRKAGLCENPQEEEGCLAGSAGGEDKEDEIYEEVLEEYDRKVKANECGQKVKRFFDEVAEVIKACGVQEIIFSRGVIGNPSAEVQLYYGVIPYYDYSCKNEIYLIICDKVYEHTTTQAFIFDNSLVFPDLSITLQLKRENSCKILHLSWLAQQKVSKSVEKAIKLLKIWNLNANSPTTNILCELAVLKSMSLSDSVSSGFRRSIASVAGGLFLKGSWVSFDFFHQVLITRENLNNLQHSAADSLFYLSNSSISFLFKRF